MQVRAFNESDTLNWDQFCEGALQATLLHTRLFLSYHCDRFVDQSLIIFEDEKWLGVFPAALQPSDEQSVVSHPGVTYGGIVHQGYLRGELMIEALRLCFNYYIEQGRTHLLYKAVPGFYHVQPAQDDIYALRRLGAKVSRCDLSSTIDLNSRSPLGERRRRSLKKAQKNGVEVSCDVDLLEAFWQVLINNLGRKHGASPVHSLDEIDLLARRFPNHIKIICATHEQEVVAGVVLFITASCYHAQYIAASESGYQISALDAVFDHCITEAHQANKRWFDFGISTEEAGTILNSGLYRFKTEFGGGGTVHEFFEINLNGELYVNS